MLVVAQKLGCFQRHRIPVVKQLMYWYHQETKHSYYSVRSKPNRMDWASQPSVYKRYPKAYPRISIDKQQKWHAIVYYSASISTKKFYPPSTYRELRVNPSAGALFPNELYFQARGVEGFEDGIYHYEVASNQAVLLKRLQEYEGIEAYVETEKGFNGLLFLVSSVYYRSSWKYKDRAFRYVLLDAGHLLGTIEHAAELQGETSALYYDFKRKQLNRLFGFSHKEFFTAGLHVGELSEQTFTVPEMDLPDIDGSGSFKVNEMMELAYKQTSFMQDKKAQTTPAIFPFAKERLEKSIVTRRSQRGFVGKMITKQEYAMIFQVLNEPIVSDCDEEIEIFMVLNRVQNMPIGLYHKGQLLKNSDFSKRAGYLCLEQYALGTDGAMTFFLLSSAKNYQALYQKAGILGQRLYIVSNYLEIGCSGIGAYYDDEVNAFVEHEGMVLYALAIGR